MGLRGLATMIGAGCIVASSLTTARASERKIGVDPRQSGLDAAIVPDAPRSSLDRFRVHLGYDLANWLRQTPWPRFGGEDTVGPRDDAAVLGYRRMGIGFGLGHGFGDRIVTGLHFQYELTRGIQRTLQPAERSPRALGFAVMPYVEFMMMRRGTVRPYVMARAGIGGSIVTADGSSPLQRRAGDTLSLLMPSVGVGMGAHAFVSRDVSLDGAVTIDHRWEFARAPGSLPDPAAVAMGQEAITTRGRHGAFGRRLNTALVLSVSRWF